MELIKFPHILLAIFLSFVAMSASQTALSPEDYWKAMLPETHMPYALKELLLQSGSEEKFYIVPAPGGFALHAGRPGRPGTNVYVGLGGVGVYGGTPFHNGGVTVGPGGVRLGGHGSPNSARTSRYSQAASDTNLHDNPHATPYFMEKDLRPGKKVNVQFQVSNAEAPFGSRPGADSTPLSSDSLPEIYDRLSLDPNSAAQAAEIRRTIKDCEEAANSDNKMCTTSLESMVDFAISKMGKHVEAISTEAEDEQMRKKYSIVAVKKLLDNKRKAVACNRRRYGGAAVFLCQQKKPFVAYKVSMVAADGSKAEAVATCHQDTSKWDTRNLAFQVLKVKPGEESVCHFQPTGDVMWVATD